MIAITFALPAESSDIVRRLHERRIETRDPETIRGKLFDRDVVILHTGVGRKACQRSIDSFLNAAHPKFVISSGFAGAVTEKFKVGDLIVAENFSDPKLAADLGKPAKLFTAPSIVESSEERNRIAREKGAGAVDMETEVIA